MQTLKCPKYNLNIDYVLLLIRALLCPLAIFISIQILNILKHGFERHDENSDEK